MPGSPPPSRRPAGLAPSDGPAGAAPVPGIRPATRLSPRLATAACADTHARSLRHHQSEFAQQAANLMGLRGSGLHQPLPHPVQRQHRLLINGLERHEAHGGPDHRLADRFGIGRIVLVGLAVRLDELRRHQLDRMAEPLQLVRPVMRTPARFHPDQARRQIHKETCHLVAFELLLEHDLAMRIHAVDLEYNSLPDRCPLS